MSLSIPRLLFIGSFSPSFKVLRIFFAFIMSFAATQVDSFSWYPRHLTEYFSFWLGLLHLRMFCTLYSK